MTLLPMFARVSRSRSPPNMQVANGMCLPPRMKLTRSELYERTVAASHACVGTWIGQASAPERAVAACHACPHNREEVGGSTSEKPSLRETSVCCGGAPQLVRLIEMRADAMRPYGEWLFRAVTLRFATVAPRFAAVARRRALRILQS